MFHTAQVRGGCTAKGQAALNRLKPENRLLYSNLVHSAARAIGRTWDGEDSSASEILNLSPKDVVDKAAYARAMLCFRDFEAAGCIAPEEPAQADSQPAGASRGRDEARRRATRT